MSLPLHSYLKECLGDHLSVADLVVDNARIPPKPEMRSSLEFQEAEAGRRTSTTHPAAASSSSHTVLLPSPKRSSLSLQSLPSLTTNSPISRWNAHSCISPNARVSNQGLSPPPRLPQRSPPSDFFRNNSRQVSSPCLPKRTPSYSSPTTTTSKMSCSKKHLPITPCLWNDDSSDDEDVVSPTSSPSSLRELLGEALQHCTVDLEDFDDDDSFTYNYRGSRRTSAVC